MVLYHHGKGPMDGVGSTVKNLVFRKVKSQQCVINSPQEFSYFAAKYVKGIISLYLPESEMMEEPEDVASAPSVQGTLKVHHVERCYEMGVCHLKFFYIAGDEEPFHTQWYRKPTDAQVCGHTIKNIGDNNCSYCQKEYDLTEWLHCPICKQRYHEACFHM